MVFSRPAGRRRSIGPAALLASVAVMTLVLAACGSPDTAPATTESSSSSGAASAAPTGAPIKTMTISAVDYNGPTYEDIQITAKLFESWVNDNGGIKGRPLEVMTCDDKGDPTQTTSCARKAIEAGAVADVGSFSFNGGVMVPIYDKAKTAVFGNCCDIAPIEFTSPNTFQMGNNPALNAGGLARAAQDGCKSIGVLELDIPGVTDALNIVFTNVAKAYGYTGKLKFVKVPLTTQDYTSQVAQITDGTDCISMFLSQSNISGMMPPFAQSGGKQRLYGAQGNFDKVATKGYEDLPGVKDGVVYGAYPPLQNPVWEDLRGAIKKYDAPKKFDYNGLATLGTWAAYTAFAQIVEKMEGEVTAETFLAAASTATVDTGGMTPVIDFTKTYDGFDGAYLRAFSRQVTYFKLSDFSQIGDSIYVDLTDAMEGKPQQ